MEILRISTSGNVDDGKSTLIGRLLYDTQSVPKDKIEAIQRVSAKRGDGELDLSLLTDGLIAEREQGITIDVAHIYFNTKNRKYIIADTPGHVEYTRNMVTGASNSQLALIMIDARNGVLEQTKRHLYINALLGISEIIVCVNKMDLVNYDETTFNQIKEEVVSLAIDLPGQPSLKFIPMSSKYGENVVSSTGEMPWYNGPSLLAELESFEVPNQDTKDVRYSVQYVVRPQKDEYADFRGYAGKVSSGSIQVGDTLTVANTGKSAKVSTIQNGEEALTVAHTGDSVTIQLDDDIDISRGDLLITGELSGKRQIESTFCWVDQEQANPMKRYLISNGQQQVQAKIANVDYTLDLKNISKDTDAKEVGLNTIGKWQIKLADEAYLDNFSDIRNNGYYVLIDPQSNNTVAVGFLS